MVPHKSKEFNGELKFITSLNTSKISELRANNNVCLAFVDPANNTFVSMSGTVEISQDPANIDEIWSPIPDLSVLNVAVDELEYWDSYSETMVKLVGLVKAIWSGGKVVGMCRVVPYKYDDSLIEEHARVSAQ
ncbi:hypothetical protein ROZALSC1DRAFT_28404 [Rozella allomycis CSF55]|uniref:FMN-binding split barrel domain-containing protein n=1 Tax=Rozella allomycis (strain CSF55) TaxID=988480 RepID=A0A075B2C1_ROZAC|nr:FMN-binding split barrel domain-containing protein [Rozella allomycis CSF55]RKP20068.1 hypothetical protein ROZALSC1DRAFT_28404 [Rozella allomycis CSF55]|eukprot:EPZ34968.1 FMN-binding split barrel domain-containing protein [Rozella allomycis CSF55]